MQLYTHTHTATDASSSGSIPAGGRHIGSSIRRRKSRVGEVQSWRIPLRLACARIVAVKKNPKWKQKGGFR
jgi:hypothetical protein